MPEPLRLLVIDDDDADRMALARALRGRDVEITEAETLAAGAELLTSPDDYDCAVIDYRLPDGDAVELLRDLSEDGSTLPPLPVVIVTGVEQEANGIASLQQGAQDYLYKHAVNAETVNRAVRYAIERHQLLASLDEQRRQLLAAQKMRAVGQLAGGIAHDFNNMLSVIIGFTSEANRKLDAHDSGGPLSSVREDLEQVLRAARRSADLTRQILAYARKQVLQPKVADACQLIHGARRLLERALSERITLRLDLRGPAYLEIDAGQLDQVLLNLALNARDAMPRGGELRIGVAACDVTEPSQDLPAGEYVRVAVEDTGAGMDSALLAQIFEPYFTTKAEGQGTGLGLAVVQGVVSQSGGHLRLDSRPDEGTRFELYFPRVAAPEPEVHALTQALRSGANTETILLVEDEPLVRDVFGEVLRASGYHVLEADGPERALALSASPDQAIHLLLTDVVMPGINGRQLAERLTVLRPDLRVLFMSGYSSDKVFREVLERGANFMPKPISPSKLLGRVRELLDQVTPPAGAV